MCKKEYPHHLNQEMRPFHDWMTAPFQSSLDSTASHNDESLLATFCLAYSLLAALAHGDSHHQLHQNNHGVVEECSWESRHDNADEARRRVLEGPLYFEDCTKNMLDGRSLGIL